MRTPDLRPLTAALLAGGLVTALPAQAVQLPPPQVVQVQGVRAAPRGPSIPQPPRGLREDFPNKAFRPVPRGIGGLPEPASPPSTPGPGPEAPCDLRVLVNRVVTTPTLTQAVSTDEPNTAVSRDTAFYAGNFYAALSPDSGMTWAEISPYTRFPAVDSGFCCDQRTLHVPSPDMTAWILEYWYSSATGWGSLRIARANGRDELRNDQWVSWVISPATFGQATGHFLDYSDLAYSNQHFYGSAIIGHGPSGGAAGLVLYRIPLGEMQGGSTINLYYYTSAQLGGYGSYRFAQGSSATMHWAAHIDTTTLRVYSWPDLATSASMTDRTVSAWSGVPTPAPGPDGRDWTGFGYTVNTVLSGYANAGEIGFLWTSGSTGATRPQTFVRVARFQAGSLSLIAEADIWNSAVAWHFPACATNARGEVGGVLTFGGGGFYPGGAAFVVDSCSPSWAPIDNSVVAWGGSGPSGNRWGDFQGADRHPVAPNTWVAATYAANTPTTAQPHHVWFGREQDHRGWVGLSVDSLPAAGVPITVDVTDVNGAKDGTTSFVRTYAPRQGYALTAPAGMVFGGTVHAFSHWLLNGATYGGPTLLVDDIGYVQDAAIVTYAAAPVLTVTSNRTAVPIAAAPADLIGRTGGTTTFDLAYAAGTSVTLTAPGSSGGIPFKGWIVNGNTTYGTTVSFPVATTMTAHAEFYVYTPGTFTAFGSGCPGSGGMVPVHTGSGTPELGQSMAWDLAQARPRSACVLYVGVSDRIYNGLGLPLDLTFVGMPGCFLRQSLDVLLPSATGAAGTASIPVLVPRGRQFLGLHLYTEWSVLDPGAQTPLTLVHSNALDTLFGGLQ